jgi:hypothetical protein
MESPFKLKKYFKTIVVLFLGGAILLAANRYNSKLIVTYLFPFLAGLIVGNMVYRIIKD